MLLFKNKKLIIISLSLLFLPIFHFSSLAFDSQTLKIVNKTEQYKVFADNIQVWGVTGIQSAKSIGLVEPGKVGEYSTEVFYIGYQVVADQPIKTSSVDLYVWRNGSPQANAKKVTLELKDGAKAQIEVQKNFGDYVIAIVTRGSAKRSIGYAGNIDYLYYDWIVTLTTKAKHWSEQL